MDEQSKHPERETLAEENARLNIQIKRLNRQLKVANDTLEILKATTNAKESLSAVITAEKTRQEKHLQVIMDNSPDVIILLDNSFQFLSASKAFLNLAGLPGRAYLYGKNFRQVFSLFFDEGWLAHKEAMFREASEKGAVQISDERLKMGRHGETRDYSIRVVPFIYSDADNSGLLIDFIDFTEHKLMEQKLKEALIDATAASKAKSEFLANMSHEIRTPMNAIIGMTAIGLNALDEERKDYCLSRIDEASKHLLGVINDILDMSKIESGKFELSDVEFNFEEMLQRVVNVVSFRVEEKRQHLTIYVDRTIPQNLVGDDQRLAQVITNLLGNAIKFTPEEGTISINTYYLESEDDVCSIKVSVTDTGIGISPEQQASLFQSFIQAETHIARKYGGTGLGLKISKSIIEKMGGSIWVESQPGEGATFTFTAILKRGVEKTEQDACEDGMENIRVLVVDDDAYILKDFKGIVKKMGVSCDNAQSGVEALELIKRNGEYDIYFLDWKMPDMSGADLTQIIKRGNTGDDNSLVIMVSLTESSEIEEEAQHAGVDKFLQKPLFPSTVGEIIGEYLRQNTDLTEDETTAAEVFEGKRILLVEDVEINREIVLSLLEPARIGVDCAANGIEAVNMFSGKPDYYDLIFMDLQMPEMDGYQATRLIRGLSHQKAKTIPIIAMTANVFKEDVESCYEAGMNGHLGKPLDFNELMKTLRENLKTTR